MQHYEESAVEGAARRAGGSIKWSMYPADVLPMWVADTDFRAPEPIIAALKGRADHGVFGYQMGDTELTAILVERLRTRHGMEVSAESILYLPGIVAGLHAVTRAFAQPGDGAILLTPLYPPFFGAVKHAGMVAQEVPLIETRTGQRLDYAIDWEALEAAITPDSKMFMLCNPHNPVGRVYRRDELERIADICLRHNLLLISDEIHCDLVYPGETHLSPASFSPEIAARTITLMAPSKTFNVPGLGLGFAVVSDPALHKTLQEATWGPAGFPTVISYAAAKAAYTECEDWLAETLTYLQGNRDAAIEYVEENLPEFALTQPEGTYLGWMDCRSLVLPEGKTPYIFFLETAKVAFSDGATFGAPGAGFVRINYGCTREMLIEAMHRVRDAVRGLDITSP